MKVEEKISYNFELENDEKDTFEDIIEILSNIYDELTERHCNTIVSGYPDCETYITRDEILNLSSTLSNLAEAWEIRKYENI